MKGSSDIVAIASHLSVCLSVCLSLSLSVAVCLCQNFGWWKQFRQLPQEARQGRDIRRMRHSRGIAGKLLMPKAHRIRSDRQRSTNTRNRAVGRRESLQTSSLYFLTINLENE